MLSRLKSTYAEYPSRFWILVGASFVDGVGRTILNPFFALYVTHRFGVGMTEAGLLFSIFSVSGFAGAMLGGALTDRFGRKGIVLFGLIFSALSSLTMGFVGRLPPLRWLRRRRLPDVLPARSAIVLYLLTTLRRVQLSVVGIWLDHRPRLWAGFPPRAPSCSLFVLDAVCS
jgi:MFS family permease